MGKLVVQTPQGIPAGKRKIVLAEISDDTRLFISPPVEGFHEITALVVIGFWCYHQNTIYFRLQNIHPISPDFSRKRPYRTEHTVITEKT
jgi:hypothetical protein